MNRNLVTFDIECYINYFLIMFKHIKSGKTKSFELSEFHKFNSSALEQFIAKKRYTFVSFNGIKYDEVMLAAAINGYSNEELKALSNEIINDGKWYWEIYNEHELPRVRWNHIDLMEVAIGKNSLKIYGGRINSQKLQDLPFPEDKVLTKDEMIGTKFYCENDLDTTYDLFKVLESDITVREEMTAKHGIDLRSKSDAQIAEALFKKQLKEIGIHAGKSPIKPGGEIYYQIPEYFWDMTDNKDILEFMHRLKRTPFVISSNGKVAVFPHQLMLEEDIKKHTIDYNKKVEDGKMHDKKTGKLKSTLEEYLESKPMIISIAGKPYKFGMGGIHSQEKKQIVKAGNGMRLAERDVASYYPNMILNQELYPRHLSKSFMGLYKKVVKHRLEAKRKKGDMSLTEEQRAHYKQVDATEKIVINGSFGKFGSPWSILYAPDLLLQVTISGQLGFAILIDKLEKINECEIVSANTDAIVVYCSDEAQVEVDKICKWWEEKTNLSLEETPYKALYSRDVNNYIGVQPSGKTKLKGAYRKPDLSKNALGYISAKAVVDYVAKGEAIEDTIELADDFTEFLCVKKVAGGGVWRDQELGRAARWYYGINGEPVRYATNGNKVGDSDGAIACMNLPDEFPSDVNFQHYIDKSIKMLKALGIEYSN